MSNTLYLLTVPNVNKINPFFSQLLQQIHKMYEKIAIITQIWHRVTWYFTSMSIDAWYLITVPNMNKITFVSGTYHNQHLFYEKWP